MDTSITDHLDRESDYGSDFTADEEEILTQLLQQHPRPQSKSDPDLDILPAQFEHDENIHCAAVSPRTSHRSRDESGPTAWKIAANKTWTSISLEGYGSTFTALETRVHRVGSESRNSPEILSGHDPTKEAPDLRSPLERFRTKPKKPLSVTDLISPSWCELQYWYVLTKRGGKVKRTLAMRQGTTVHKRLENQVHQTVSVDVATMEDAWGLRIWNVIHGLRTLRETGMTRELEVWGVVDGLVINGVIDELSYVCPDRELEAAAGPGVGLSDTDRLPADQATIESYFEPAIDQPNGSSMLNEINSLVKKTPRIYLTDVKTRGVNKLPQGSAVRSTLMQLMIYHRLLSDLATDTVDSAVLFDRYSLDPAKTFSDALIAQCSNLNGDLREATSDPDSGQISSSDPTRPYDALQLLLDHNSLNQLWALMIEEFQQTMAHGAASIGKVLKVEYRAALSGSILGIKTFLYDQDVIQSYLDNQIRWWRGERESLGVCEQEAYKCGSCEFADDCTWRKERIDEATQRHRTRTRSVV